MIIDYGLRGHRVKILFIINLVYFTFNIVVMMLQKITVRFTHSSSASAMSHERVNYIPISTNTDELSFNNFVRFLLNIYLSTLYLVSKHHVFIILLYTFTLLHRHTPRTPILRLIYLHPSSLVSHIRCAQLERVWCTGANKRDS